MIFKRSLISLALMFSVATQANFFKANQALNDEEYSVAKIELEASAKIGNAEAQFLLALLNYQGKAGEVDKLSAVAWFFMAAEYEYPNSIEFASEIYQSLTAEEKTQARALAAQLKEQYGIQTLETTLFPIIHQEPVESQKFTKPARMLVRGELSYTRGVAEARNQSAINSMQLGLGGNVNNLSKMLVEDDSGLVIIQYDVAVDGRARDAEILFSWPRGRFSDASLSSVNTSKLKPAENDSVKKEQYGLVSFAGFGLRERSNLKVDYPHQYTSFRKYRKQAEESVSAKYTYACFLRAYGPYLPEADAVNFETVLLEAAEGGFAPAQYDLAQQQIFINKDIDAGLPWLLTAAKNGFSAAEYRLGDLLYNSPSVYLEQDIQKAKIWFSAAAAQNHYKAQQKLTDILFKESESQQTRLEPSVIEQSISWLNHIIDEDEADANTYFLLAKAYQAQGELSLAKANIDSAIELANYYEWDASAWQNYKKSLDNSLNKNG